MLDKLKEYIAVICMVITVLFIVLTIIILIGIAHTFFLDFVYKSPSPYPLYISSPLTKALLFTLTEIKLFIRNTRLLLSILGYYTSIMGIFFNVCEIYYSKKIKQLTVDEAFLMSARESFEKTKSMFSKILTLPLRYVFIFILILSNRGCDTLEQFYFINQNKELYTRDYYAYVLKSFSFHIKVIFAYIFNIIVIIFIIASPLIIYRLILTIGFWGTISSFILLSRYIADYFHIKASIPIFSMLLTLIGIIISILGARL